MYAKRKKVERWPFFVLLDALVGETLLSVMYEQARASSWVYSAMSGGFVTGGNAIKIMVKLACNLGVGIRM
jgi:hypothetical protein